MPVTLDNSGDSPLIRISGVTTPDEADQLLNLLREYNGSAVDLAELEHLHTALLQLLLVAKVPVVAWPEDPFWRSCFPAAPFNPDIINLKEL